MSAEQLTGRTRYRETWLLKRLVLQVERVRYAQCEQGFVPCLSWRDARAEDFSTAAERELFKQAPMPFPGQRLPGLQPET